jgi:predicted PurR-regulated permease PerM
MSSQTSGSREKKIHEGKALGAFILACSVFIAGIMFLYQAILVPAVVGLVFAYLLYPFVEWIVLRTKWQRSYVVLATILTFILFLATILIVFAPPLYKQVGQLIDLAPSAYHKFLRTWLPLVKDFVVEYKVMSAAQFDSIYENVTVGSKFFDAFKDTVATVWRTAPKVFGTMVGIFLVPLVAFIVLQKFHSIRSYFYGLVPKSALRATNDILHRLNLTLRGVIKGQVYVALSLGVMYVIGFSAVGLKAGAAIGIVCGVARLVPYLDIVVGLFLSFIVIVSHFTGWPVVIGVGLVILIVQALDGMIITPKLIGKNAGLHPIIVICSIIAFSGLFGFWGVLVAIPTVAVFRQIIKIGLTYYIATDLYKR